MQGEIEKMEKIKKYIPKIVRYDALYANNCYIIFYIIFI